MKTLTKVLTLLLCLCGFYLQAQDQYIKYITSSISGNRIRVVPSMADDGFVVFALDSSIIYKIGDCGNIVWSKKLSVSLGPYNYADVAALRDGSFALLLRLISGTESSMQLSRISSAGNLLWSKTYGITNYQMYPYTISQDANGHLIMYGNISYQNIGPNFNLLTKLDTSGNVIWCKAYDLGMIWGGCLNTSDGGYLMRTSSTFIKTDGGGNIQWHSNFAVSAYYYYAPVEVSDGYIFNGRNNATNELYFYKMDKQGNGAWSGTKRLNISNYPQLMHSKPNGNFVTTFDKSIGGKLYMGILELDKEASIVSSSLLNISDPHTVLFAGDICFTKNNVPVVAGRVVNNASAYTYFSRMNSSYQTSCDTTFVITQSSDSVLTFPLSLTASDFTLNVNSQNQSSVDLPGNTVFLCSNFPPLQLNLNDNAAICNGTQAVLQNTTASNFENYLWSTGETTPSITVTDTGLYILQASGNCDLDTLIDSVYVSSVNIAHPPQLRDTTICDNPSVVLDATTANASYLWQDGSVNATYVATQQGDYFVDITIAQCTRRVYTNVDECEILTMPNIFTPNGDPYNNAFVPIKMLGIKKAELFVYNRWGQKIFTTTDLKNKGWNGRHNSKRSSDGVYFWIVDYENYHGEKKNQHGTVHVIDNS